MKSARSRGKGGFTLLEALISVILLGVVGLSFAYLYIASNQFMIQSVGFTSNQSEAAFALEHIKRYLTAATAVTIPAVGAPAGGILQFTWQSTAANVPVTSQYDLSAAKEMQFTPDVTAGGAPEIVAHGIQDITFSQPNRGTVTIDVTAQPAASDPKQKVHLQLTVNPRGISP